MPRVQRDALGHRVAFEAARLVGAGFETLNFPVLGIPKALFVDPRKIEFFAGAKKDVLMSRRLFRSAPWLAERKPLSEEEKDFRYTTCRQFLFDEVEVSETEEYGHLVGRLSQHGVSRGGMSSTQEIVKYLEEIRRMYLEVRELGRLRTQEELGQRPYGGEINFLLDRDLTLLKTTDGNHRFAVARILGLNRIPIQINVVHSDLIPSVVSRGPKRAIQVLSTFLHSIEELYR